MLESSFLQTLGYASVFAAFMTLVIAAASGAFLLIYLRDKSRSRYDDVHRRAELSEMRKSYEEQIKLLTLQLSSTDQRWKELNHLLLSSQRFEASDKEVSQNEFLRSMGIRDEELKTDPKLVLLLTPFNESFDESYRTVVELCRQVGLTCVRGDEQDAHGDILSHILRLMVRARFVIANIGSRNPNVYYELGIAHALDKPTILISETIADIPFDIQSKRILIYRSIDELKEHLPSMLARALASETNQQLPPRESPKSEEIALSPFIPRSASDGIGLMRDNSDYLCITNDGETLFLPNSPYIFLRLIPSRSSKIASEVEAYRIAQAHLRPMQGSRSSNWRHGRHETGTVAFVPNPKAKNLALDASELYLSGELWANDFYFLDPKRDRAAEIGFAFIPTGAVEQVLTSTLKNFVEIAQNHLKIQPPIGIEAGLVGIQNYRLAVDPKYFAFSDFEGRIVRRWISYEAILREWPSNSFDVLKPLFEKIYDSAGLKRPDVAI